MKAHLRSLALVGLTLLIVVIIVYAFTRRSPTTEQTFQAIINRDCAPWDGSAFTVSIPLKDANISVSIYQAGIKIPTAFSFPDDTMSVGSALLILPSHSPEQLTGKVSFQRVDQDNPVEGIFDLTTPRGQKFKGRFVAEWGNDVVYCG